MPPDDDLDSLIAQSKQKLEAGAGAAKEAVTDAGDDLDALIAKSRAKMESALPYNDSPKPESHWYDMFTPSTDEQWAQSVDAAGKGAEQLGAQVGDIQSSPGNVAKFAGRTAAGLGGQYLGGALGTAPVTSAARVALPLAESTIARAPALLGALSRGVNVAAPAARVGLGAAGGGISAGTDAFAHGAPVLPATGAGMAFGAGLTGAGEALAGMGRGAQGSSNRKLAERALSSPELADVRAEGGSAGVKKAGQELRDLGVTKSRGLLDFFRGNTPERMSENSLDILNNARKELDRAGSAVTDAPARDVSVISNDPDPVTVGQAPVDVSPVSRRLHSQADAFDYAKNPDKAQTYRNLATELTTPAKPQAPRPNASFEPVALESRAPETPDAPVSQVPLESRLPEQPIDPAALSSEPTGPIERNAPPMSSQPMDNLLDLPPPTGPGEIDTTSHLANTYRASSPTVSSEPILDLEPTGRVRNPAMEAGAGDANMSPSPYEDLMSGMPEPQMRRPEALPVPANEDLLNQVGSQLRDVPVTPGGERVPIGGHHQRRMDRLESGVPDLNANAPGVQTPDHNLLSGLGEQMDMLPSQKWGAGKPVSIHDAPETFPQGQAPVDTSYWPAPYEMSRNEPPMPPQEPGLAPARSTVLEHTPRFKGDSPGPGLELDQPRQDFQPDNLLAPTALYPDNPPLPSGELAPPGMSRRAPIVGPVQRTPESKLTGARPTTSSLTPGSAEPVDVSGISPTSAPMDSGFFPQTPRPMTPADPSTGFTLEQLMAMRRELGNQTRNFSGRPLNKVEGDMGAATRDAWKGSGDAITGALNQHVEAGNLTPDIVSDYRDANKTFSTIADVNKNLANRTNQAYKEPSTITGGETVIGGGTKATAAVAQKMLGLNAQYGIGKGLEGAGAVGSDLARMGAGLGWNHPEIEKAKQDNPGAPKAEVEQKANDDMKTQLQKTWYNVLSKATSMFQ